MTETVTCQRCRLPALTPHYRLRVDAEPPDPSAGPVELVLCASCLESMQRWVGRHRGQDRDRDRGRHPSVSGGSPEARVFRREHRDRSRFARELSEREGWLRTGAALTAAAAVLAVTVGFGLFALGLVAGRPSGPPDGGAAPPAAPALGGVDLGGEGGVK